MIDAKNVTAKREEIAFRRLGVFQWMSRATVICYRLGVTKNVSSGSDGRGNAGHMSPKRDRTI